MLAPINIHGPSAPDNHTVTSQKSGKNAIARLASASSATQAKTVPRQIQRPEGGSTAKKAQYLGAIRFPNPPRLYSIAAIPKHSSDETTKMPHAKYPQPTLAHIWSTYTDVPISQESPDSVMVARNIQ